MSLGTPPVRPTEVVESVRARVLDATRWVGLAVIPFAIALAAREALAGGQRPSVFFEGATYVTLIALLWALRRRSQQIQAAVLVIGIEIAGGFGLSYYGPLAGVGSTLGLGVLFAVVFFGWRGGAAATAFMVACMVLGAFAVHHGLLAFSGAGPWDFDTPANWLRMSVTLLLIAICATVLLASVLGGLERSLAALTESLAREEALREQRERALKALADAQRLEGLGRLASGVAHEVNNALAVVLCNVEVMRKHRDPAILRQAADDIARAAEGGADVTRQLLAFGRGAAGRRVPVEPAAIVERLGRTLSRLMPPDIHVRIEASTSRRIFADDAQLDQALLNLALNARDAMPDGGELRLAAYDGPGDDVVLEVSDTGTGMDEATRERVFEPFFTTKERGQGTGLGLALVHGVVTQHGARIDMDTALGKGTTFHLRFPAAAVASDDSRAPSDVRPARTGHVLLAEDVASLRDVMRRWLEEAEFTVTDAADVDAAIALCEAPDARFDLLLTDGVMPGARPISELLASFEARHGGPIVVCSGYVAEDLVRRGIDTGQYHFVRKPFEPARLVELLGGALAERETRAAAG